MSCLSAFAAPTVDFYENDGVATQISATTFRLDMTVKNNMDTEPSPNPYGDYVSAFKIDGIYSSETPSLSNMPASWATGTFGYTTIVLTDPAKRLWAVIAGTTRSSARIAPGSSRTFNITLTLPPGIPASRVRYGAVAAQGRTEGHGMQPYPIPDTFVGVVGIEEGEGVRVSGGGGRGGLAGAARAGGGAGVCAGGRG